MSRAALSFADPSRIPSLATLINAAFAVEKDIIAGDRTSADELASLLASGKILIAEEDARIVGCVYLELEGDEAAYFGLLAIAPELQGRGLGRLLVQAAEDWARRERRREMTLKIIDQRPELLAYYERLGYRAVAEEPFPDGVVQIIPGKMIKMTKPLW